MLNVYRYRFDPTDEPADFLNRQFWSVRCVYNWALALATTTYQAQGQGITRFPLDTRLTALKQELSRLGEVASQPLRQALVHLDTGSTRFFSGEKRVSPRQVEARMVTRDFIPKASQFTGRTGSFFPKPGWVRAVFSQRFTGGFKTIPVCRIPSGRFFLSLPVEDESQIPDPVPEETKRRRRGSEPTRFRGPVHRRQDPELATAKTRIGTTEDLAPAPCQEG